MPSSGTGTVLEAAMAWARAKGVPGRIFRRAITDVQPRADLFARARWRGRSRQISVRQAATSSRSRTLATPLEPSRFNPWIEDPSFLANRTRQLATCRTCRGERSVACAECGGAGQLACQICSGHGRYWSSRSRRFVSCRACKGDGQRRCRCRDGALRCSTCQGKGKVEEWLEIEETPFVRVSTTSENLLSRSFASFSAPEDFEAGGSGWPVQPIVSWTGASPTEAPAEIRALLDQLQPATALHPHRDRLDRVDLQVFRGEVQRIAFELAGQGGSVEIAGWNGQVFEVDLGLQPIRRLRLRCAAVVGAALVLGLSLATWYGGRHPFFAAQPNATWLWLLAPLLALATLPLAFVSALPRVARTSRLLSTAGTGVLALLLTQWVAATTGLPSLEHASTEAATGRIDSALLEASACAQLGFNAAEASAFHDQLLIEQALQNQAVARAWAWWRRAFLTTAGSNQAADHALELTWRQAALALDRGRVDEAEGLLAEIPELYARDSRIQPFRLRAFQQRVERCALRFDERCLARQLNLAQRAGLPSSDVAALRGQAETAARPFFVSAWTVIRTARSLSERLDACREVQGPLSFLVGLDASSFSPESSEQDVQELCARLREQQAREARRAAEREERRRTTVHQRWAMAPLLCRDGTLSPSCLCGRSSYRGCCSHHGGVAGCSQPLPD